MRQSPLGINFKSDSYPERASVQQMCPSGQERHLRRVGDHRQGHSKQFGLNLLGIKSQKGNCEFLLNKIKQENCWIVYRATAAINMVMDAV